MNRHLATALLFVMSTSTLPASGQVVLTNAFPNLTFSRAVDLQTANDGRLFVVEQAGIIRVFDNDPGVSTSEIFLDIRDRVRLAGEQGLLGLTFHPAFPDSLHFYVNYTQPGPISTVSRFSVDSENPNRGDADSELVVLTVAQPAGNHNGGQIAFGPDGYLYTSLGDGGGAGDPSANGQDPTTLLGAILRLDVANAVPSAPYQIPPDNPFVANLDGWREEIFAYGLRNPWRFSFDPLTGEIWAGDVGQNTVEEIDLIASGANYGWNIMEGFRCYNAASCDQTGLTLPVFEYDRTDDDRSITGGYVYRGECASALSGRYVYGDYVSGRIWQLDNGVTGSPVNALIVDSPHQIPSFGTDQDNELYVLTFGGSVQSVLNADDERPSFTSAPPESATEDQQFSYDISISDPDVAGAVVEGYTVPGWLNLQDDGDGTASLTGTPSDSDVGINVVVLRARESAGCSSSYQHFVIEVAGVNDAPTVDLQSPIVALADEDLPFEITIPASDPDSETLTWTVTPVLPAWLTLTVNQNHSATLSGTPTQDDVQPASSHTVTVSDGQLEASVQLELTVNPTNDAPSIDAQSPLTVAAEEDVPFELALSASDPDNEVLTWAVTPDLPSWLILADSQDKSATLAGTPTQDDVQEETDYTVTVSDGDLQASVVLSLSVSAVNDPPSAPEILEPMDNADWTVEGDPTALLRVSWTPSADPDLESGASLTYEWQLSDQSGFGKGDLLSIPTDTTFVDISIEDIAAALDAAGVSPGGTVGLFHRVVASDGLLETASASFGLSITRGAVTAVDHVASVPLQFTLMQNYPNPFNPATTVRFGLPEGADVQVSVFDLSGRTLAVIASGPHSAGWHEAAWSGDGLASGVYFFQLVADGFEQTRSMLLLK